MSFFYNTALKEVLDRTIDLVGDTLKAIPVAAGYVANRDDDLADAGGANDVSDHEITADGYARGHAAAGRKVLTTKSITVDKANDRAVFTSDPFGWNGLGGAINDTIAGYVIVKETGADDTTTRLIAYIDAVDGYPTLPFATNGSDLTVAPNANGLVQFPTI